MLHPSVIIPRPSRHPQVVTPGARQRDPVSIGCQSGGGAHPPIPASSLIRATLPQDCGKEERREQGNPMQTTVLYVAAALAEIAGCYAFWAWLGLDRSPLWLVPGMRSETRAGATAWA